MLDSTAAAIALDRQRPDRVEVAVDALMRDKTASLQELIDREWEHVVGQRVLKRQLERWAMTAVCDTMRKQLATNPDLAHHPSVRAIQTAPTPLRHLLFLGPPGTGQSRNCIHSNWATPVYPKHNCS
jgi:hypothetical protein